MSVMDARALYLAAWSESLKLCRCTAMQAWSWLEHLHELIHLAVMCSAAMMMLSSAVAEELQQQFSHAMPYDAM